MTRTAAREIAIQLAFGISMHPEDEIQTIEGFFDKEYYSTLKSEDELFSEYPDKKQLRYIAALVTGVSEKKDELDGYIEKYARGWKLNRISKISLAVLRCSMYEILYMPDVPNAASINEAVELAKGYEEPETVSFINGILGSFIRGEVEGGSADTDADSDPTEQQD
jgi:N utilization substance protein B